MPREGGGKLIVQKGIGNYYFGVAILSEDLPAVSPDVITLGSDYDWIATVRLIVSCRSVFRQSRLEFAAFSVKSMFMISGGSGTDRSGATACRLAALALAGILITAAASPVAAQMFIDRPPPVPPASVPEPSGPAMNLAPPSGPVPMPSLSPPVT